jgi:ubiquinone biosynthesis protein COQ4
VFTIIEALSGDANARIVRGFEASATGRQLIAERPRLLPRLADRSALARLPAGTLGRAYLAFCDARGSAPTGSRRRRRTDRRACTRRDRSRSSWASACASRTTSGTR